MKLKDAEYIFSLMLKRRDSLYRIQNLENHIFDQEEKILIVRMHRDKIKEIEKQIEELNL